MNVRRLPNSQPGALDDLVCVALSRRNLEGLLAQLDAAKKGDPAQIMRRADGTMVIIVAEEDDAHYNSDAREERVRGKAGSSVPGQPYASVPAPECVCGCESRA